MCKLHLCVCFAKETHLEIDIIGCQIIHGDVIPHHKTNKLYTLIDFYVVRAISDAVHFNNNNQNAYSIGKSFNVKTLHGNA